MEKALCMEKALVFTFTIPCFLVSEFYIELVFFFKYFEENVIY